MIITLAILLAVAGVGLTVPLAAQAQTSTRVGETVLLQGQVTDTEGNPIAGASVELWQADSNGKYNHPSDATGSTLLADFQYFGTATADAEGNYAFLTVKPAQYETRPPHFHFKVKIDGKEVLTSQFYFEEDRAVAEQDGAFANAGNTLFLQTVDSTDSAGNPLRIATGNIVLDLNGNAANTLTPTATQTEGPYYPVVDFSAYDNNLISVAADDAVVTPVVAAPTFTLINLNTATAEQLLTIPDMNNRMVREFQEYRPYISIAQFRREIGKYVNAEQVAAYEKYVYVPVQINDSDAATLKQIPGVDDAIAEKLIAARPYADQAAFLAKLGEFLSPAQVAYTTNYLEAQ
jgi:DNA uptake protein ComE-like DNA-binding protein